VRQQRLKQCCGERCEPKVGELTGGSHHNQKEPRPEDVVVVEHDEGWGWKGICIR